MLRRNRERAQKGVGRLLRRCDTKRRRWFRTAWLDWKREYRRLCPLVTGRTPSESVFLVQRLPCHPVAGRTQGPRQNQRTWFGPAGKTIKGESDREQAVSWIEVLCVPMITRCSRCSEWAGFSSCRLITASEQHERMWMFVARCLAGLLASPLGSCHWQCGEVKRL